MTVAVFANISVQLLCSFVALKAFWSLGNFTVDAVVDDARNYRLTEAHSPDRMDKVGWVSLAHRVCEQDGSLVFGNFQVGKLKEIEAYMQDVAGFGREYGMGFVLALACLFFFFLNIANELLDCLRFLEAILSVPWRFQRTCFINVDGDATLIFISVWRLVLLILMVSARMAVAVLLLVGGGVWLSN